MNLSAMYPETGGIAWIGMTDMFPGAATAPDCSKIFAVFTPWSPFHAQICNASQPIVFMKSDLSKSPPMLRTSEAILVIFKMLTIDHDDEDQKRQKQKRRPGMITMRRMKYLCYQQAHSAGRSPERKVLVDRACSGVVRATVGLFWRDEMGRAQKKRPQNRAQLKSC